jgi:hypothetical protein
MFAGMAKPMATLPPERERMALLLPTERGPGRVAGGRPWLSGVSARLTGPAVPGRGARLPAEPGHSLTEPAAGAPGRGPLSHLCSNDPELLAVVAVADERAKLTLDLMANNREEALQYVAEVRKRIDLLHELEERAK